LAASDARDSIPDAAEPPQAPGRTDGKRRIRLGSGVLAGLFTLAIFYTLYFASALFIPIALALLLNLLLTPVVRGLRRHLHLPEGFGAGLVLVLLLATVAVSFYGLSGPATRWLAELPVAMVNVEHKLETLRRPVEEVQQAANRVADMATPDEAPGEEPIPVALQGPSLTEMFLGGAMTLVAGLVIMVALLFFLLASGDTLLRQAVSIAPRLHDKSAWSRSCATSRTTSPTTC
jgi:predicted PurR-regulated permease PerM